MKWPMRTVAVAIVAAASVMVASAEQATPRSQRTTITFDAPLRVPGVTLQPGSYTFELVNWDTSRHTVRILNEDRTKVFATTQAVPTRRADAVGDTVLKLQPYDGEAVAAIQAWFYPGMTYGHEFLYSDEEARDIARRTKTLVLSQETPDADGKAQLYIYDANGNRRAWTPDPDMTRAWSEWQLASARTGQDATGRTVSPGTSDTKPSTAPMVADVPAQPARSVTLGELEEQPDRYVGQTVTVTGEVEDIFGPRLFKIDEQNWSDLDGELLVFLPVGLAAMVDEDDDVTVTGKVRRLNGTELQRELQWVTATDESWFGWGDSDETDAVVDRPVIVASHIVGGDSDTALWIDIPRSDGDNTHSRPVAAMDALTDAALVAGGAADLIGRTVTLDNVMVERAAGHHGLWVRAGGKRIFVLPSNVSATSDIAAHNRVSITGTVLRLPLNVPDSWSAMVHRHPDANQDIYIFATRVK